MWSIFWKKGQKHVFCTLFQNIFGTSLYAFEILKFGQIVALNMTLFLSFYLLPNICKIRRYVYLKYMLTKVKMVFFQVFALDYSTVWKQAKINPKMHVLAFVMDWFKILMFIPSEAPLKDLHWDYVSSGKKR